MKNRIVGMLNTSFEEAIIKWKDIMKGFIIKSSMDAISKYGLINNVRVMSERVIKVKLITII